MMRICGLQPAGTCLPDQTVQARGYPLFIRIPDLGWLLLLVLISALVPLLVYIAGRVKKDNSLFDVASKGMFVTMLFQVVGLAIFLARVKNGQYAPPEAEGLYSTALQANPFCSPGSWAASWPACFISFCCGGARGCRK